MPAKKDFDALLGGDAPPPNIRRGIGMRLSTDAPPVAPVSLGLSVPSDAPDSAGANAQKRTASEKRGPGPRGIAVSPDLVDRLKIVAIKKKRKLYEVMDEAMTQYLQREEG